MAYFEVNPSNPGTMPGNAQFPIRPISVKEPHVIAPKVLKHAQEYFVSGNYLGAMKICRALLTNNKTDYEAQLLLGRAMASYKMELSAEAAFRAAIEINAHDIRGWQGLCELQEGSGQKTSALFRLYLSIMTIARPKSRLEWVHVCDKALSLHKALGGKPTTNLKLQAIKQAMISCSNYNIHSKVVMSKWRDMIYSSPKKQAAEVDQIIMKDVCRMIKDYPGSDKMDKMKCDILFTLTNKPKWAEVEAKCILMHKTYPWERLPMEILARQFIKTDTAATKDLHLQIYEDLYDLDNSSPLAALGFGQALVSQGNYQSGITWLAQGLSVEAQSIHGWLYLAKAHLELKNLKEAHLCAGKGLELLKMKPSSSSTRSLKSQLELIRSQSAGTGDDTITVIGELVERIPVQTMTNQTPIDLYQALIAACKCLHQQQEPTRQSGAESLQGWRREKRSEYNLQHAVRYWNSGMATRTDPWMFLTAILKALKHDPWSADVFLFIGLYLWEILAELRLAKDFFELSYQLNPDDTSCSYLVDLYMVLQEKHMAMRLIMENLQKSSNAKGAWLRLGLLQMVDGNLNLAEQSFWNAINGDSRSDRQPYECLARNRLQRFQVLDAKQAFGCGAKFQTVGYQPVSPIIAGERATLEASDIRAIYNDTRLWVARPQQLGVQFAFSILFAICPELLRPIGSDYDRLVRARKAITNVYNRGLNNAGKRIDWGHADYQCAYMLRWFLIHCQFVPRLLHSCSTILTKFPKGNHLRVCCVGGGPGSDIIGLLTFLRTIDRCSRLTCHVLDKFPAWENVWKHIQPRLPPPSVDATYSSLDMTSSSSLDRSTMDVIRQADIVTFVKSVSPVAAFLKQTPPTPATLIPQYPVSPVQSQRGTIPTILRALKKGALVIYVDNRTGPQNTVFREIANEAGLKVIHNKILTCDIQANTSEYNAVWNPINCQACASCKLHGSIFYKS